MQTDSQTCDGRHIPLLALAAVLSMFLLAIQPQIARATTFVPWLTRDTSITPTAMDVGDVNSDGRDDVVVANFNGNSISVFLQETSGTLSSAIDYPLLPTERQPVTIPGFTWLRTHPSGVVIEDMDSDGANDVVVSDEWNWSVFYFQQDNPMSYTDPLDNTPDFWQPQKTVQATLKQPVTPTTMFTNANVGDGEAFAYRFYFSDINLLEPGDKLTLTGGEGVVLSYTAPYAASDFYTPILYGSGPMKIEFTIGSGAPTTSSTWELGPYHMWFDYRNTHPFSQPYSLASGDLLEQRPGREVVAADFLHAGVQLFVSEPPTIPPFDVATRTIQGIWWKNGEGPVNQACYGVAVGDLNYDFTDDMAAAGWTGGAKLVRQSSTQWLIGDIELALGNNLFGIDIGDLNQDRRNDVAATSYGGNTVGFALQNSAAYFFEPQQLNTGSKPMGLTIADVTADGANDIVVANSHGNSIGVFTQSLTSPGVFSQQAAYTAGWYPYSVKAADLDGDGGNEIVATNANSDDIIVFQPSPLATWVTPADKARVRGLIRPTIAAPAGTGIESVNFYVDSVPWPTDWLPPYQFDLATDLLPDGGHVLRAVTSDENGHTYSMDRSITVDNTKPVISYVSATPNPFYPIRRDRYKDNCYFKFKVNEQARVSVKIYLNSRLVKTISGSGRAGWNTLTWDGRKSNGTRSVGNYAYRIYATDLAGNTSYSSLKTVALRYYVLVRVGSNRIVLVPH